MQFPRGGKGVAVLEECEIVHVTLRPKNGLSTPQTQRPSIMISTRPILVTTTESYRDCGTERRMAQELGRLDGPKVKLALSAGDLGGFSAASSTKRTGHEP